MVHTGPESVAPARSLRPLVLAAVVVSLTVAVLVLPIAEPGLAVVAWVRDLGPPGMALYVILYAVATALLVPGSLLTIGAGLIYGLGAGVAVVVPGSLLGALAAFAIGRWLAHDWVARRLARSPRLTAIDEAIGDKGVAIVLLLRLSPLVPFTVVNYLLALTRVRLRDYTLGSAIGMAPGIVLYVYLGSLVTDTAELAGGGAPEAGLAGQIGFYGGLAATVLVTLLLSRWAGQRLRRAVAAP